MKPVMRCRFHLHGILIFTSQVFIFFAMAQQKVIPLYQNVAPGSERWTWKEKEFMAGPPMNAIVAYNISMPTLTVFEPRDPNGVAVILAPGGGLRVVNYEREGAMVAKELNDMGITAFVLKYRVAKSETDDPWQEMMNLMRNDRKKYQETVAGIPAMIQADANTAMTYLQMHADELHIDRSKIGVMGFSGGGLVARTLAIQASPEHRPAFAGFIYCIYDSIFSSMPSDVPPAFVACAADDILAPPMNSIQIFQAFLQVNKASELHIMSKASNNFHGLRFNYGPGWINRFEDWLVVLGILQHE